MSTLSRVYALDPAQAPPASLGHAGTPARARSEKALSTTNAGAAPTERRAHSRATSQVSHATHAPPLPPPPRLDDAKTSRNSSHLPQGVLTPINLRALTDRLRSLPTDPAHPEAKGLGLASPFDTRGGTVISARSVSGRSARDAAAPSVATHTHVGRDASVRAPSVAPTQPSYRPPSAAPSAARTVATPLTSRTPVPLTPKTPRGHSREPSVADRSYADLSQVQGGLVFDPNYTLASQSQPLPPPAPSQAPTHTRALSNPHTVPQPTTPARTPSRQPTPLAHQQATPSHRPTTPAHHPTTPARQPSPARPTPVHQQPPLPSIPTLPLNPTPQPVLAPQPPTTPSRQPPALAEDTPRTLGQSTGFGADLSRFPSSGTELGPYDSISVMERRRMWGTNVDGVGPGGETTYEGAHPHEQYYHPAQQAEMYYPQHMMAEQMYQQPMPTGQMHHPQHMSAGQMYQQHMPTGQMYHPQPVLAGQMEQVQMPLPLGPMGGPGGHMGPQIGLGPPPDEYDRNSEGITVRSPVGFSEQMSPPSTQAPDMGLPPDMHTLRDQLNEAAFIEQQVMDAHIANQVQEAAGLASAAAKLEAAEKELRHLQAKLIAERVGRTEVERKAQERQKAAGKYKTELETAVRALRKAREDEKRTEREKRHAARAFEGARDQLYKYHEEIKVRDALEKGRKQGRDEAWEEAERWLGRDPPIVVPPPPVAKEITPAPPRMRTPAQEFQDAVQSGLNVPTPVRAPPSQDVPRTVPASGTTAQAPTPQEWHYAPSQPIIPPPPTLPPPSQTGPQYGFLSTARTASPTPSRRHTRSVSAPLVRGPAPEPPAPGAAETYLENLAGATDASLRGVANAPSPAPQSVHTTALSVDKPTPPTPRIPSCTPSAMRQQHTRSVSAGSFHPADPASHFHAHVHVPGAAFEDRYPVFTPSRPVSDKPKTPAPSAPSGSIDPANVGVPRSDSSVTSHARTTRSSQRSRALAGALRSDDMDPALLSTVEEEDSPAPPPVPTPAPSSRRYPPSDLNYARPTPVMPTPLSHTRTGPPVAEYEERSSLGLSGIDAHIRPPTIVVQPPSSHDRTPTPRRTPQPTPQPVPQPTPQPRAATGASAPSDAGRNIARSRPMTPAAPTQPAATSRAPSRNATPVQAAEPELIERTTVLERFTTRNSVANEPVQPAQATQASVNPAAVPLPPTHPSAPTVYSSIPSDKDRLLTPKPPKARTPHPSQGSMQSMQSRPVTPARSRAATVETISDPQADFVFPTPQPHQPHQQPQPPPPQLPPQPQSQPQAPYSAAPYNYPLPPSRAPSQAPSIAPSRYSNMSRRTVDPRGMPLPPSRMGSRAPSVDPRTVRLPGSAGTRYSSRTGHTGHGSEWATVLDHTR